MLRDQSHADHPSCFHPAAIPPCHGLSTWAEPQRNCCLVPVLLAMALDLRVVHRSQCCPSWGCAPWSFSAREKSSPTSLEQLQHKKRNLRKSITDCQQGRSSEIPCVLGGIQGRGKCDLPKVTYLSVAASSNDCKISVRATSSGVILWQHFTGRQQVTLFLASLKQAGAWVTLVPGHARTRSAQSSG